MAFIDASDRAAEIIGAVQTGDATRYAAVADGAEALAAGDIFVASVLGDADAIGRLIDQGVALAAMPGGPKGYRPLHYLAASRFHRLAPDGAARLERAARLLLERGADANAEYFEPEFPDSPLTALYLAAGVADNPAVVRVLLEAGANPNDGESIYHAAEHNHRECLELLARHGASLSARTTPWNNTPLYFLLGYRESDAGWESATEGARWLLEHGADPNVTSYDIEETPLHLAIRNGRGLPTITMLLEHGADPAAVRADGGTPYQLAVRYGQPVVAELLARRCNPADLSLADRFVGALMMGDGDRARAMLIDDPGLMRTLSDQDRAILVDAAIRNRLDAVRLMLSVGFDPGVRDELGATALHHAAWRGYREMVEVLIDADAPLDLRSTSYDATPLQWAAHGSLAGRASSDEEYGAVAAALVKAGAGTDGVAPEHASPAVAAALRAAGS